MKNRIFIYILCIFFIAGCKVKDIPCQEYRMDGDLEKEEIDMIGKVLMKALGKAPYKKETIPTLYFLLIDYKHRDNFTVKLISEENETGLALNNQFNELLKKDKYLLKKDQVILLCYSVGIYYGNDRRDHTNYSVYKKTIRKIKQKYKEVNVLPFCSFNEKTNS